MITKDLDFPATQEAEKQKTAVYEKELAKLKQEVSYKSADPLKIEQLTSTINTLESKSTLLRLELRSWRRGTLHQRKGLKRAPGRRLLPNRLLPTFRPSYKLPKSSPKCSRHVAGHDDSSG